MNSSFLKLLNIKPHESERVTKLFFIQFCLGIATAFLFTASLAMFLSSYKINRLPEVFIASAIIILIFNAIYSKLEERFSSTKLLRIITLFSAITTLILWIALEYFKFYWLSFLLSVWYMLLYMLVGYAFWGIAAILFNVRESKRLFSILGAGDIPAKMLGYFCVSVLVPFIGLNNLLWISILSFMGAFLLINKYEKKGLIAHIADDHSVHKQFEDVHYFNPINFIKRNFKNRLILFIAILSFLSFTAFAFIDFTFLSDIKIKYKNEKEVATFIAIFFASGRILAIIIKLLFSSRMIARIGLSNALLATPVILLLIDIFLIQSGNDFSNHLYLFGAMVLFTEILRSTLQDPVFFILFQPLKAHDRLKGHLIAKGYMMPFSLILAGSIILWYITKFEFISITTVARILIVFLVAWIFTIFLIKKEYLKTLVTSLRKGYFTGAELFLNDEKITSLLIEKTKSKKPSEVIHALNLLERAGFEDIFQLHLSFLESAGFEIKNYVLSRVIHNKNVSALPQIILQLEANNDPLIKQKLIIAYYLLNNNAIEKIEDLVLPEDYLLKKAALTGLLKRDEIIINNIVILELKTMASGNDVANKQMVLDLMMETSFANQQNVLSVLLNDNLHHIYKKAIEVTGKIKEEALLPAISKIIKKEKIYPVFQKFVQLYGDELYTVQNLKSIEPDERMIGSLIKIAGKIKGDQSLHFLYSVLKNKTPYTPQIIDAMWQKKKSLPDDVKKIIEEWIQATAENNKTKVQYFHEVTGNKQLKLLAEAIRSEIETDLRYLLKAFALVFDREKIDRIMELIALRNSEKISNAIEIVELALPYKIFNQLNVLIEFYIDVNQSYTYISPKKENYKPTIIRDILINHKSVFGYWTKSIACFVMPKLKNHESSIRILKNVPPSENILFSETKAHILTMLK